MLTHSAPPNIQPNLRCYHVAYDDDLDTWSVVAIPFDGIYFRGSKMQCEAFALKHNERLHPGQLTNWRRRSRPRAQSQRMFSR